ncbi:MAG: 4-hydroxy-tetrahydrodipicolinate reductase [Chitinophagaceae bacterium]
MRIALIGYGKMGKIIEEIALQRGHQVVLKIDSKNQSELTSKNLQQADVAIEFTNPHSANDHVKLCIDSAVPVVSGSTGWNEKLEEIKHFCTKNNGTLLHASNFSIGVNIFFNINQQLAKLMSAYPEYEPRLEEIHHTEKKDAPSGTAVTLAEDILFLLPNKNRWVNNETSEPDVIPVISKRIDPAAGTHHVKYTSAIDDIEIIHTAHNRKGFAFGAVLAAEFIKGKKGVFSMNDVLDAAK